MSSSVRVTTSLRVHAENPGRALCVWCAFDGIAVDACVTLLDSHRTTFCEDHWRKLDRLGTGDAAAPDEKHERDKRGR